MSCRVNTGDGRSSASRRSSQSRIPLSGARSPGKSASAACNPCSERPSSRGSGGGACSSCGTNFHSVIQNLSCSCGPGGRMSLGGTTKSVRSARKAPTATSRASHCSTSSCKTAVPVITRATTGAGLRCTRTLLPAARRTASSQATPRSRATACAAASGASSAADGCSVADSVREYRARRLGGGRRARWRPETASGSGRRLRRSVGPAGAGSRASRPSTARSARAASRARRRAAGTGSGG